MRLKCCFHRSEQDPVKVILATLDVHKTVASRWRIFWFLKIFIYDITL